MTDRMVERGRWRLSAPRLSWRKIPITLTIGVLSEIACLQHLRAVSSDTGVQSSIERHPMTMRICAVLCFAAAISVTVAAQDEPVLVSANIPKHPPLACQARIEGLVKLSFTLAANATEATNVEVVSGHAMLKDAAMENLSTWRFGNHHADGKYETTFVYRLPSS